MKKSLFNNRKIEIEIYDKREKIKRPLWGEQWNQQVMEYLRSIGDEKKLNEYIKNYVSGLCLIIGVSTGYEIQRLQKFSKYIVGIDISSSRIFECHKNHNYKKASCIVCDAENLPFKNEVFNFILCRATLHHLSVNYSLMQIYFVMKNYAYLCLQEPGYLNFIAFIGRTFFPTKSHTPGEKPFVFYNLRKLVNLRGFNELKSSYFYLITPIIPIIIKYLKLPYKLIIKSILVFETILCKSPLKNLSWCYVSVWRKISQI